jgi:hypothetical protein
MVLSCQEDRQIPLQISEIPELITLPVSVHLGSVPDGHYSIIAKINTEEMHIPVQSDDNRLWFSLTQENTDRKATYYVKNIGQNTMGHPLLSASKKNGDLQLSQGGIPLISYRYEMTYPPNGIDSVFKKSGYVHPLRTLKGDTLSRIQPPDHYHHYGLWGPWTHTQINDQQVDFWNLGDRKGTVLFKDFVSNTSGNVFAAFEAVQQHIDLITGEVPQVALNENLKVILWHLDRPDRYMFDYTTTFNTPLPSGILFEAYRYGGGIGMRFTERWHRGNSAVLTSEGHDRSTADGTRARWCIVSGESTDGKGKNGILFLSHPNNREHPEPMRVWPMDANEGRGDMFFEFCPIRYEEWPIKPEQEYQLKYRMVVFDGELLPEEAEAYWQGFAHPPKIAIKTDQR